MSSSVPLKRLAILGGLLPGLLFGAQPALALDDKVVELQLSAASLADLVRRELAATDVCPEPIPCPGGGDCYLDHIEIPGPGTFQRGASGASVALGDGTLMPGVMPVQLHQPIDVFVKTAACVEDPSCAPNDYLLTGQVDAVLEFSLQVASGGEIRICGDLVGTSPDLGVSGALPEISACGDLPTDSFAALLKDLPLTRQGLSLSADASRLGVRLEFDPGAANLGEWGGFLAGTLASEPTQSELAVIFERSLLQDVFKSFIDLGSIDEVNPDGPKTSSWLPLGPLGAVISVTTPGEAIVPVCPDIDLDINTSFVLHFEPATDELVIDATFDIDLNEWDMLACTALTAGWGGPALMAIAAPILTAIAHGLAPDAEEIQGQSSDIPDECTVSGEDSFECRFPMDLDAIDLMAAAPPVANLDMQGQMALQGSFSLVGDVDVAGLVFTPSMSHAVSDVAFHVGHDCHTVTAGYTGWVNFYGNAAICDVDLRDDLDPKGVYQVTETNQNGHLPATFEVELAPPSYDAGATFWWQPYGFGMTIYTTAGARTVQTGAPTEVSQAGQEAAILAVTATMPVDCTEWSEGWLGDPGGYNPLWDIDPPPFEVVEDTLIQPADAVLGRGFTRELLEKVSVMDAEKLSATTKAVRSTSDAKAVRSTVDAETKALDPAATKDVSQTLLGR